MNIIWKIFTPANTAKKAGTVLNKVIDALEIKYDLPNIEPYHKGGYVCSFVIEEESNNWAEIVYKTLQQAQIIGRSFSITGNINKELDLWSNESLIVGVESVHICTTSNA